MGCPLQRAESEIMLKKQQRCNLFYRAADLSGIRTCLQKCKMRGLNMEGCYKNVSNTGITIINEQFKRIPTEAGVYIVYII